MDGDKSIIPNEPEEKKYSSNTIALFVFSLLLILSSTFLMINTFSGSIALASLQNSTYNYYLNNNSLHDNQNNQNNDDVLAAENTLVTKSELTAIPLTEVKKYEFNAESAIVVKITPHSKETVFEKDKDKKLPIASLTKLMTALLVLEKYDLNTKTTINEAAMSQTGEQGSLKLRETLSVKNLLYISLIESSNRAAYALAEIMGVDNFVSLMNQRAEELGLLHTHFADSSGLNQDSYSTAQDLANLSEYLYENQPLFREIISIKEYNLYLDNGTFHHKLINTNNLLGIVPGVVGGKTGFTNEARGCYMVIKKNPDNAYFINIVLGSEDRLSAVEYLIENFNGV